MKKKIGDMVLMAFFLIITMVAWGSVGHSWIGVGWSIVVAIVVSLASILVVYNVGYHFDD